MKGTILRCASNVLLFTLFGLAFAFPTTGVAPLETPYLTGIEANITIFPIFLLAFLIFAIIYFVLTKKLPWGKHTHSELLYSDEREKIIVAESTKTAYKTLMIGLPVAIGVLFGLRFFSLFAGLAVNIYAASILLLTALLNIAMISYCVKWCREYRK